MFDVIIPTCCIEGRVDVSHPWDEKQKKERGVETRKRSRGGSQEAKSKGREWKDSGEESEEDEKEHIPETAWYKLDLPIAKLQMKEMKVGIQNA